MSSVSTLGSAQVTSEISQVETRLEAPITQLNTEVTTDKAVISSWGGIKGAISTLSQSLSGISSLSTLNNRSVSSTLTTVATATAGIGAQTGTFALSGVALAKTQEIYSSILGSAAAPLSGSAGALTFALKNGKTEQVSVGSGSLTLNGVAAAINKTPGGVKASVIGTATGARLVLQSSATGSSQAFSVAGTGALAKFNYSSGTGSSSVSGEVRAQSATNAALSINGVPVTSATNTLSSAISGVTLNLQGSGNTTVTVSSAPNSLSAAVSSVASSLNAALSTIAKAIAYVPASTNASGSASAAKSGPLLGNFTATNLSDQLLTAVSGAVASGISANAIGLSVSSAGAVSFNSTSFAAAYEKNPAAVQSLITNIYKTLSTISSGAIGNAGSAVTSTGNTGKNTGSIGAQTTALQGMITSIDAQVAQITKINNAQISLLVTEYTAAENETTAASITKSYLDIFTGSSSSS
jgi:flagellar hook-associated protein 2